MPNLSNSMIIPLARRRLLLLPLFLLLGTSLGGCYTFRVSEDFFLPPMEFSKATIEDSLEARSLSEAAVVDSLGDEYSLQHKRIPVDGATLQAVFIRHSEATRTVLYFGGNRFLMNVLGLRVAQSLTAAGEMNLLLVDHRGYGESTGEPTMKRLKDDALLAYEYATDTLGAAPENLVVHGHSLGSFLAGHVAVHRPTAGLVLESSATTVEEWAHSAVPWYYEPFVRIKIGKNVQGEGNLHRVRQLNEPLLLLVGADDQQAKPVLSRGLYDAATLPESQKELYVLKGSKHTDVMQHPRFEHIYEDFLTRAVGSPDTTHSAVSGSR